MPFTDAQYEFMTRHMVRRMDSIIHTLMDQLDPPSISRDEFLATAFPDERVRDSLMVAAQNRPNDLKGRKERISAGPYTVEWDQDVHGLMFFPSPFKQPKEFVKRVKEIVGSEVERPNEIVRGAVRFRLAASAIMQFTTTANEINYLWPEFSAALSENLHEKDSLHVKGDIKKLAALRAAFAKAKPKPPASELWPGYREDIEEANKWLLLEPLAPKNEKLKAVADKLWITATSAQSKADEGAAVINDFMSRMRQRSPSAKKFVTPLIAL